MRRLPFERKYLLETIPCPRCAGSGRYAHPSRQLPPACMDCRGLGRKATAEALRLFYVVCDLLGKPLSPELREGRIEPRHLDNIPARSVRKGMCVGALPPRRKTSPKVVTYLEPMPLEQIRVVYSDGTSTTAAPHDLFARQLTEIEVARVELVMARYSGKGAVALSHDGGA